MNNKFDQFIGVGKALKLNSDEKKDVRAQLVLFMAKQKVALSEEEKLESRHFLQMFMRRLPQTYHWIHFSLRSFTAAFAVIALFSGSLAYAAEDTVPGDALYSLKVDVVEPLRGHLKFTPEAKAEWNARRIERRLEEGQRLMSRGGGNVEEHLPKLQERLEMHTRRLEQRLEKLESDDNAEKIRARIEHTLQRHEEMLNAIESGEVEPKQMREFMQSIKKRRMQMHEFKRPERKERMHRERKMRGSRA